MTQLHEVPTEISSHVAIITPEDAARMLERNDGNRKLAPSMVSHLAGAMARGEWALNGESIKIAASGKLLDGQHRLAAVVKCGKPVKMLVVSGLPESAFETIDTGRPRGLKDILTIAGVSNAVGIAATIAMTWKYLNGRTLRAHSRPTHAQAFDVLNRFPHIGQSWLTVMNAAQQSGFAANVPPCMLGTIHVLATAGGHGEKVTDFVYRVGDGAGLPDGSPVLLLRNRFIKDRASKSKIQRTERFALAVKAWNAFAAGASPKVLKWTAQEDFPSIACGPSPIASVE